MNGSVAKGLFFANLAVVGIIAVLVVYQVPQPWRGVLVAWLMLLVSAGTFVLKILKHHYEYKSLQLTTKQPPRRPPTAQRSRKATRVQANGLKVVLSKSVGSGRHVIR